MTYEITGSGDAGAVHLNVTFPPSAEAVKFNGADGIAAAAPVDRVAALWFARQARSASPPRQRARSTCDPIDDTAMVARSPSDGAEAARVDSARVGAAGAEGDPAHADTIPAMAA